MDTDNTLAAWGRLELGTIVLSVTLFVCGVGLWWPAVAYQWLTTAAMVEISGDVTIAAHEVTPTVESVIGLIAEQGACAGWDAYGNLVATSCDPDVELNVALTDMTHSLGESGSGTGAITNTVQDTP